MPPSKASSSVGSHDLLTCLPPDIIVKILGHVPIREAVRTSVLSSQWRHIWCYIPDLVFPDSCAKTNDYKRLSDDDNDAFVRFVYRVLLLHRGPVHRFEVIGTSGPMLYDIYHWVTFLSRNGISELSLKFGYHYKVPSSLFQCDKLTALSLRCFEISELPAGFEGFKSLKRLVLKDIMIDITSLEKLISVCPILESLMLYDIHSELFKIQAPLLKYLHLQGESQGFILEKTRLLEEISVTITYDVSQYCCTPIQFIDQVPLLKKLTGHMYFTKYLHVVKDPTTIGISLNHLWFINLSIHFDDPTEVRLLIRLMSFSPVLKELQIKGVRRPSKFPSFSDLRPEARDVGCQLLRLQRVKMEFDSGSIKEMKFVKFVLLNSPALEILTLSTQFHMPQDVIMKVLVELLRCRRASNKAQVIF